MVKYRYALNSANLLVAAESLAGKEIKDTYSCVGCFRPLVARVNGAIQQPHFGHKVSGECNGETYLHQLGKRAFIETYRVCVERGEPFMISLETARTCTKYKQFLGHSCIVGEDCRQYDLTQYYSSLRVETREGEFVPDVTLSSKERPDDTVFVEIAVSHFLSETKSTCGKRIIEIPIQSEEDVAAIYGKNLTPKNASFVGFQPQDSAIPDEECDCRHRHVFAFYVFDSGKAFLDDCQLRVLRSKIQNCHGNLIYVNTILPGEEFETPLIGKTRGELFVEQVRLAKQRNVPLRNCYLCRYQGHNWVPYSKYKIHCKTLGIKCDSNEAVHCKRYRLKRGY